MRKCPKHNTDHMCLACSVLLIFMKNHIYADEMHLQFFPFSYVSVIDLVSLFSWISSLILTIFFNQQWGAAYSVRGGPEKEMKAMEVCFFTEFIDSICPIYFVEIYMVRICIQYNFGGEQDYFYLVKWVKIHQATEIISFG